jgi:hypothetical protein
MPSSFFFNFEIFLFEGYLNAIHEYVNLNTQSFVSKIHIANIQLSLLIQVIIHIYMEMSQGNSLYSYLKQTKNVFCFFYKMGEQEGRTGPVWGQVVGKGYGRVNMVQIWCTPCMQIENGIC